MGTAIRRVSHKMLTAVDAAWEDVTPTTEVLEYSYDARHPREFYVYPPNDGTGAVRAIGSEFPASLVLESDSDNVTEWGAQVVEIPDEYVEAIAHFVLFKAFTKEAEWALDPVRAKLHYEAFINILNAKTEADAMFVDAGGTQ